MIDKKRITLLGPSHPYRGGIAQYTDSLYLALKKRADVDIVSFKRLYPAILYPGKSDKVEGVSEIKEKNQRFILDFLSVLSWNQAIREIQKNKPDAVIIAWWTFIWQPALGYIAWRLRKKNIKVIYLCHNVTDHEESWVKRKISSATIRIANGYIIHSQDEAKKLLQIKPSAKILARAHPIYTHFPEPNKALTKRGRLDLLYFGLIRPYKGVDVLIEAMDKLNDKDVHLSIVGEVWGKDEKASLIKDIKSSPTNIDFDFRYINEQEAANYFSRADAIVLPYKSATGSGVVTLAYHYLKPVVATKVGGLKDVVLDGKTGWLVDPDSPSKLASVLQKLSREKVKGREKYIKEYCKENSWGEMAKSIDNFISDIS